MGSEAVIGPQWLVDMRTVFDATVEAAVAGLHDLAASMPRQSDAERYRHRLLTISPLSKNPGSVIYARLPPPPPPDVKLSYPLLHRLHPRMATQSVVSLMTQHLP